MVRRFLIFIVILTISISLVADWVNNSIANEKLNIAGESTNFGSRNDAVKHVNMRGTPFQAKELTLKAYDYILKNGRDKAFKAFEDPNSEFFYLDLYIFVSDMKGKMLVHGRDKSLRGKNLYDLKDSKGTFFIQKFIKKMQLCDESWTDYHWRNYETNEVESKLTFLKKIDDNTFIGCGPYYKK